MNSKKAKSEPATRSFIERHTVFTTAEFRSTFPEGTPSSTVLNRLKQAHESGHVERIRHGVYASRLGALATTMPDPLLVASRLKEDYAIAYHSALEAHGVAHAPFRRVTVVSNRTPLRFEYRGHEFVVRRPPKALMAKEGDLWKTMVVPLRRGDALINVTSRERTLVDCFENLKWAGGIEEVLRSVGGFPSLKVQYVIAYAELLASPSTVARVGWVLSADPDMWRVTEEELRALRSLLGRGPYFLSARSGSMQYVPDWRLYVPAGLDAAEEMRG